jgi:hypothetical protein
MLSWLGEVALMAANLRKLGTLTKISVRVRFAWRRGVYYEVIDFLAVQIALCRETGNAPWKPSTRGSSPLQVRSWRFLTVTN